MSASKPHKQKILPVRGGLWTCNLRNASSMLFQLSYAVRSEWGLEICVSQLEERRASILKVAGSKPTADRSNFSLWGLDALTWDHLYIQVIYSATPKSK